MSALLAVAVIVAVAAVTPGPNNLIVMGRAAHGGLAAAAPAIFGVLAGTLALLALVWAGAGAAFAAEPRLRAALAAAGCLYLVWLGASVVRRAGAPASRAAALPRTALGLAAFQLLNPKSWVMVATATAVSSGEIQGPASLAALAALFTLVPGACLTLWALAGRALAAWMARPRARLWLDRALGGLLIASAAALLV